MENNQSGSNFMQVRNQSRPEGFGDTKEGIETVELVPISRLGPRRKQPTTVGFQKGNWEKALKTKQERSNRYYKNEQVPYCEQLKFFQMYGPGIYLFFSFLKKVTILFLVLSFIALLPIIYNAVEGDSFNNIGDGIQTYYAKTTIGNYYNTYNADDTNKSRKNKYINIIPHIFIMIIFVVFYFYWDHKSRKEIKKIKYSIKLPYYRAIELIQFSSQAKPKDVAEFMGKFGTVTQVAPVKDQANTIQLSREIYENYLKIKQATLTYPQEQIDKHVKDYQQDNEKLQKKLEAEQLKKSNDIIKFYVTFSTVAEREESLNELQKFQSLLTCCRDASPENVLLCGQPVVVAPCRTSPSDIIWQNMHITWKQRLLRALLQGLLLLILLGVCFLLISLLNILAPPLSNENVDTSGYKQISIQSESNAAIVESWCLKNINNIQQANTIQICSEYLTKYYIKVAITIAVSFAIIIVKFILKIVLGFIAKFQRYTSHSEQSLSIMTNLFVSYVATTILIPLLLQAKLFTISFKNGVLFMIKDGSLILNLQLITEYQDFTSDWYLDVGYQIGLTWLISSVSPHCILPLYHFVYEKYGQYKGQQQLLHKNMERAIQPQEFQIQDHYANVLTLIFVSILFCGGMPILIIFTLIGLFTRYLYFKYVFLRYCRVPKAFDQSFNEKTLNYFIVTIICAFMVSVWMYGVEQVFMLQYSFLNEYTKKLESGFLRGLTIFVQRIVVNWYLVLVFMVCMIAIFLKQVIFNLILVLVNGREKTCMVKKQEQDHKNECRSERSLTSSYKMEQNPDYFQIVAIMGRKNSLNVG